MEIMWRKFRESFEKFIVQDLKKALNAEVEVGVIILTVVGIESLSGYYAGRKSDDETFKAFIDAFMPEYSTHAVILYKCIRNGLAHDYIIKEYEGKSFLFTRNAGEKHLTPVSQRNGWFYLNRRQFSLDFLKAQEYFFEELEVNNELQEKALSRLNKKGFLDVFSFHVESIFVDSGNNEDEYNSATGTFSKGY